MRSGVRGHSGYSVRITANSINKAMKSLEERVDRASVDALMEIAEKGKEFAEDLYATAKYDGEHDAKLYITKEGERTVDLTAVGDSVLFIEYGTGLWGSGKKFWYFSSKGRDVKLSSTGKPTWYIRGGKKKVKRYYVGKNNSKNYLSDWGFDYNRRRRGEFDDLENPKTVTFEVQRSYNDDRTGEVGYQTYDVETEVEYTPTEYVERSDSFVTAGNPPQMIMQRTREYMTSIAPDIISKHLKK